MTQLKNNKDERLGYIDILRLFACFLVILTHSVIPGKVNVETSIINFLGSPSSELFLSLSGAVLLPIKVSFRDFYKRRFMKLLPPVFFWSLIALSVEYFVNGSSLYVVLKKILYMPIHEVNGVYWFVYVMMGLYLIAPFISPWLKQSTKKQVELFLFIWCINMLIPWVQIFIPDFVDNLGSHYWSLHLFSGFLGYWLLGYYLRFYPINIGLNVRWTIVCVGSIIYIIAVFLLKHFNIATTATTADNLQIGGALIVALLYTIAQNLKVSDNIQSLVSDVAKLSFGIYLSHIIVERELMWCLFGIIDLSPAVSSIFCTIFSFSFCYILIKFLSRLPLHKYTIGV